MALSALRGAQKNRGAVFADDASSELLPIDFGNPHAEYDAAATGTVVFGLSNRTQIELTGNDRVSFLHNFCTNDIKALRAGHGCEAFLTNVKGRVLGHVFVFVDENALWLESAPNAANALIEHLGRYIITEDVALRDRSTDLCELFVSGPQTEEHLQSLGLLDNDFELYQHRRETLLGASLTLRRVDWLGNPGFLIVVPTTQVTDIWCRLVETAIHPAGTAVFEALRIEAGMPIYGRDITEDNLAQEVSRTSAAISFTKGCYLGQEPIARLDALGHVNRELRGLRLEAGPIPEIGSAITADGDHIGNVTSSALSFADECPVALGYLKAGYSKPGTRVEIDIAGHPTGATVFWPGN